LNEDYIIYDDDKLNINEIIYYQPHLENELLEKIEKYDEFIFINK